jgi:CubicO group peptidase (beta-lactamase class C family)
MEGIWLPSGYNSIYYSSARNAALFGLYYERQGLWNGQRLLPTQYLLESTQSSQQINLSYGLLWWLNGKASLIPPGFTQSIPISLAPSAPADLFAALGKNGQFIDIVPSLDAVVVRFGDNPENALVPITYHNEMWKLILPLFDQ